MKAAAAQPEVEQLRLVAMALAGYNGASNGGQSSSLWQQLCITLLPTLRDPYLTAIFLFLSSKGRLEKDSNFGHLMKLPELPLYDRVAFAAIHFADHPLAETFEKLANEAAVTGDLFGLLLTGVHAGDKCMELLQNYIDKTGDIQTVALLLIHSGCIPPRAFVGRRLSSSGGKTLPLEETSESPGWNFVEAYFILLNSWKLWHTRVQTEALINQKHAAEGSSPRLKSQVSLICTFCSKTIWIHMGRHRGRSQLKGGACPYCRKPLPRCTLCRKHIGTPLSADQERSNTGRQEKQKFGSWFTWCQSCRHGGHAVHIADWFSENSECPVTGCACKCAQLDTIETSK